VSREHQFIEVALQQVGAPYIWGGKGPHLFDAKRGLVGNPFIGNDWGKPPMLVFDCSGLITYALWKSGGADKRAHWNSQVMMEACPTYPAAESSRHVHHTHLRFYGKDAANVSHVAVGLGFIDNRVLVLEAAGGDHTTTTVLEAERRAARVRCQFERRADLVATRSLPI